MKRILVTNDDGYNSAGYMPLIKALTKNASVIAVAPDCGKSWTGKAITTKKTLKVKKVRIGETEIFTINGNPADCVQIGLYNISSSRPDLVVSGINIGPNIGNARMLSSGTVGAAMEASLDGLKAVASSLLIPISIKNTADFYSTKTYPIFKQAADITAKIAGIIQENDFKDVDLFSINIPFDATIDSDLEITKPFTTPYGQLFHKNRDGFVLKTPRVEFKNMEQKTDIKAVYDEKISITPVSLSLVSSSSFKTVENIISKSW